MVLEKDSSVLGYPGEISKPLDADHHDVCKYASPIDPRYVTVRNALKSLIGKVKPDGPLPSLTPLANESDHTGSEAAAEKSSEADFAEYLALYESPDADYNFFRDRWTPGTCTWILKHEAFAEWMDDVRSKPRVLWVHGNAGGGKSILSSFLIDQLVQLGLPCHYFFIRFMSQEKRGISMMLRSLACQLAKSTPAYAEKIRQLEAAATDFKTAEYRNIWQWLFKQALFKLDELTRPLYLVIDGVDEADRPASVVKLLADLHLTSLPIRVLVVSRNTHEISSAFQKLAKQVHMETIRIEGNPTDLRAYVDHELDLGGDSGYQGQVTNQLLDRAKGNFLWVHLAVQKINSCHTRLDVENALMELPSGMEALYDRMALSVEAASEANRKLGRTILGWTTCAQRLLSVEELSDALGNDGMLEIHRTIADVCGGFITVDHEGKAAMIHETAREYLTRRTEQYRPLTINIKSTNDMLFKRCIARLTDPTLRGQINRGRPPALVHYAATAWPHHLALSSVLTNSDILDTAANFLKGPHVLTWIYVAARSKELRALVVTSRHLADIASKLQRRSNESVISRQAAALFEGWATDLVKILGKFGSNLRRYPDSIYKLIPPFCPRDSVIYQQFGRKESRSLQVSGFTTATWDDCLARFSMSQGAVASAMIGAGSRIAVLSVSGKTSQIILYNSTTFEEQRRITHPERVLAIQANKLGGTIVSYGFTTTRVWDAATGDCLKTINNPAKRPRPHSIFFAEKHNTLVVCGEDRCIRSCSLDDDSAKQWKLLSQIDEESLGDTIVNFPTCSALSPDGAMVAFGYRNHPLTVWELEPPMLLGQCHVRLDETDMTVEDHTWGEVFRLAWHPLSGEIFGLTLVGLLFRWDPHEEETTMTIHSGGDCLAVSSDGSLVATGDGVGTIKIYAADDFSKLYQLSSQDPVLQLAFSTDSRRLYDIRGLYGNVWEPNTLVRLADCPDNNSSDASSETESIAKGSLLPEHHFAMVDSVVTLSGQSFGPLYCYGTENGVATLCEAGRGKVCELERLASLMPIEQVVWSGDGKLAALADLSGRLAIKKITRSGEQRDSWQVSHEFDLVIPPERGSISQLFFHPTSTMLFAATPERLFLVDLETRTLAESNPESMPTKLKAKWACHPTSPDLLLGFGNSKVHVVSWKGLREKEVHTYFPPRLVRSSTISISSPSAYGGTGSFQKDTETLGRLITNIDSPEILLEILSPTPSGQVESQYLLFDMDELRLSGAGSRGGRSQENHEMMMPYTVLAPNISSQIREPLAILSRRRLVFLHVDRWICTWKLPSVAGEAFRAHGKGSEVEQYYFLPGDWVTSSETRLCTVTPDGTLLCPRNGEVVTVQAARLRK